MLERIGLHNYPGIATKIVRAGETLYEQGDLSSRILILKKGRVRINMTDENGQMIAYSVRPVSFLGGEKNQWESAVATTDSEILCIDQGFLKSIAKKDPEIISEVLFGVASRLRNSISAFQRFAFGQKIRNLAFSLAMHLPEESCITEPVTHQQLATESKSTRETVTKHIAILEQKDIIRRGSKKTYVIPNLDSLLSFAKGKKGNQR